LTLSTLLNDLKILPTSGLQYRACYETKGWVSITNHEEDSESDCGKSKVLQIVSGGEDKTMVLGN
jgi:hypothetical protein